MIYTAAPRDLTALTIIPGRRSVLLLCLPVSSVTWLYWAETALVLLCFSFYQAVALANRSTELIAWEKKNKSPRMPEDIAGEWSPGITVTLIHSKIALADVELQPCVRQAIKDILLEKGVELVLGQRVTNLNELTLNVVQENMELHLDKDTEVITADLILCCIGLKINSSCYMDAFGDKVASNGALKVNDHLQVEGYNNIYAVGDCADLSGPKMAYNAGLHAKIAVTNIIHSLMDKPLKTYKTGPVTMLLSMGRNAGVGQINGFYLGSFFVTRAKSRDIFVSKSWKEMGQKMPE